MEKLESPAERGPDRRRAVAPAILLGIGLGGFVDGIVLHQLLQWHHMVSNTDRFPTTTVEGLEGNTVGDGLFHAATLVAVVTAVLLGWRAARRGAIRWDTRNLVGWMLVGWGAFNLVEGLVDHHLLRLHHVREGVANEALYDLAFLIAGVVLVVVGVAMGRSRPASSPAAGAMTGGTRARLGRGTARVRRGGDRGSRYAGGEAR